MKKVKVYLLYDDDERPHRITYEVENEVHLQNILAGTLIIADREGKCPDKCFAWYGGIWWFAVPETIDKCSNKQQSDACNFLMKEKERE